MKFLIASFVFIFIFIRCGTDTGNPGARLPDNLSAEGDLTVPDQLINQACLKLNSCYVEVNKLACEEVLLTHSPVIPKIGLSLSDYNDLSEVKMAEIDSDIKFDSAKVKLCLEEINHLTCADPILEKAYQPNEVNPFNEVEMIFPETCKNIQ